MAGAAASLTKVIQLDVDENVISIKDVVGECLGLVKKDVLDLRILGWSDDGWTSFELVVGSNITRERLEEEFEGCFAVKNVYLNGVIVDGCLEDDSTASPDLSECDDDEAETGSGSSTSMEEQSSEEEDEEDDDSSDSSDDDSSDSSSTTSSSSSSSASDAEQLYTTFPVLDRTPNPYSASLHPLLTDLIRSGRLIIGDTSTGNVAEAEGYGPADDGKSVLIYGTF
jgi:hypothetical protein